jgi:hypothetical protein
MVLRLDGRACEKAADVAIAKMLGRSAAAVKKQRHALSWVLARRRPPEWTRAKDCKLVALRKEGRTFSEIGKLLGTTKNAAVGRYHSLTRGRGGLREESR